MTEWEAVKCRLPFREKDSPPCLLELSILPVGLAKQLNEIIQSRLFPILRVRPGFVDEIVLESDVEPNRVVTLSFWRTREQAERYNQETYPTVKEVLAASLGADPIARTFTVTNSTTCNIAARNTT